MILTRPNQSASAGTPGMPGRRRPPLWIMILLVLMVLVPFFFWHGTWFGRSLSDKETGEYLADTTRPRLTQHALVQMGERLARGDMTVRQWYPQILQLTRHEQPEIRSTVAWLMGQDVETKEFRSALGSLLRDSHPLVRQNTALSLVRFGDAGGRFVLQQMLLPYPITAPRAGTLEIRLQPTATVNPGTLLGHVRVNTEEAAELRSPLPGTVRRWLVAGGTRVSVDEPVVLLDPDETQVWEALRALLLVGEADDLELIEPYARGAPRMSGRIQQQATLTLEAIRQRVAAQDEAAAEEGSG
jgi:hypothetical protein